MKNLNDALEWLRREVSHTSFGVVGLSVVIHGNRIKLIEKSIKEKEQLEEE